MLGYDIDKMLFRIPAEQHSFEEIREILHRSEEMKDDLYVFIGELIGTKKAMKIIEGGKE